MCLSAHEIVKKKKKKKLSRTYSKYLFFVFLDVPFFFSYYLIFLCQQQVHFFPHDWDTKNVSYSPTSQRLSKEKETARMHIYI